MLAKARAKPGAERVRWIAHDVLTPLPFAAASFDRVLSGLVIEHIPVAALAGFFAELGRVARPGGRIVVTAMHPAMFVKGVSANFHDESGEVRPRSYVATLSDYVMGATSAGLGITGLVERTVDADLVERYERARKFLDWPALFVMELRPPR